VSFIVVEKNCEKKNPEKKKSISLYFSLIKKVRRIKNIENKGIVYGDKATIGFIFSVLIKPPLLDDALKE